ncbi:homogentisate 1,2-dioxygenase [Novosphingobium sp. BL-8A]|uniref:homogentisate 1,2-dioxygenase n=1 Tax=Novosphingobium sp. BL-8A TaxID=3127639 RepID=UPI00375837F8
MTTSKARAIPLHGRKPILLAALLCAGAAQAQEPAQDVPRTVPSPIACPPGPPALPAELAAWNQRMPLAAARNAKQVLTVARLDLGRAVDGELAPTRKVRYATPPGQPGASTSFGGLYAFSVSQPGDYRIVLGTAAWIDVVKPARDSKPETSTTHGRGPDCSGIRKMIDFPLQPGDYVLQISGSPDARVPLLIVPAA